MVRLASVNTGMRKFITWYPTKTVFNIAEKKIIYLCSRFREYYSLM